MRRPAVTMSTSITSCATSIRSGAAPPREPSPPGGAWNGSWKSGAPRSCMSDFDDYEIGGAEADDAEADDDGESGESGESSKARARKRKAAKRSR